MPSAKHMNWIVCMSYSYAGIVPYMSLVSCSVYYAVIPVVIFITGTP